MNIFRKEFRFTGSGGQGLIVAGIILARAAVYEGYRVTQTQSYGPESRGGSSRADVIIANTEIYYPEAMNFDYLIALTQESADKSIYDLKENGMLVIDTSLVKHLGMTINNLVEVNLTEMTLERLGTMLPINVVSLSCVAKLSNIVTDKSLEKAIKESFKANLIEINLKAMQLGFELAEQSKF